MPHYASERKAALLKKLLPPINLSVAELARQEGIDDARFALLHLVDGRFHVVVDAAPGNPAQCRKRAGVGIEQLSCPCVG